ncbi:MAG: Ig-like domain-containing protein [bacterium]|nr:Ig-like domain-containing protein [bacterium]
MHANNIGFRVFRWPVLALLGILVMSTSAFAQGSIFGIVANSDLSTPANGEITFIGYLDDTDEEIRIETSDGAGYDAGNWFDDFQNYLTEAPGNPYDYHFFNTTNGQTFQLSNSIPNNSFQQENVLLAAASWPAAVTGLSSTGLSGSSVMISWNGTAGLTYHVYRRLAVSNGSFFRIDDPSGSLANPGVADSFFIDTGVDGVSSYDYLVVAENGAGDLAPHSAVLTVNSAVLAAPVLASIDPNNGVTQGGQLINLYGSGFDPAGVDIQFGAQVIPATVISPFHLTMTTPLGVAGPVDVFVTNTASASASNTLIGGFTYNPNSAPALAAIGAQAVTEGSLLQFTATATDLDGDTPVMTSSALPGLATYVDNADGSGTFSWTPGFVEAGIYNVTFYATDAVSASLVDSEQVVITVNEAGNQTPVLAAIGAQSTTENTQLLFAVNASDPDATTPTLSTSTLPGTAAFVDNGDGSGSFDWTPGFVEAGIYNVTFYASDGVATDSEQVVLTVNEAGNQLPVLAAIGPQAATEGVLLTVNVSATDAEGIPALTTSTLPTGALFTDNADGSGALTWTPDFTQAGSYDVSFYASDGVDTDSELVTITVAESGNQSPVLAAIGAQSTTENVQLTFAVSGSDPDGTTPALSTSALPGTALFTDNGDGTGSFDWTPSFVDAGSYNITFYASDGVATDSEQVAITVNEAGNQLPVLAAIGAQSTDENLLLSFAVSAADAEGIPTLTTSALPTGAAFVDNGDGTGSFDWTPDFTQAGTYDLSFYASDGVDSDSELVTITVLEVGNQFPILAAIGAQGVVENVQLTFAVTATDPDGTIPALTTSALPGTALFNDNGDGSGNFDWTPLFTDAGTYDVTFYANDGALTDSEVVTITVADAGDQPPVLALIGPQTGTENVLLTIPVSATDPEGATPILSAAALPTGALFTDNADGTGSFEWTPDFTQAGLYDVTFFASDGVQLDSEIVTITINDAGNQPPVLATIGNQVTVEGAQLLIPIVATDAESIPSILADSLPVGATMVDNLDGTATFDWTPGFAEAGSYNVLFYATDGFLADSELVTITVSDAGAQAPIVTAVADTSVLEGDQIVLVVSAFDPDGGAVFITANHNLNNFTFTDSGNGVATLAYNPDFFDAGVDSIVFLATDFDTPQQSGSAITSLVTVEVNQAPAFVPMTPLAVEINKTLTATVVAHDSTDSNILHLLYMSATGLPPNATFVDNGNKTGTLTFSPVPGQEGVYPITFIVTDQGSPQLSASMPIDITVQAVNTPPVLSPVGPQTVLEGEVLTLNLSAADPDGNIPWFTADTSNLKGNATFVDNGDGTAVFTFSPSFVQAGLAFVEFYAHDGIDYTKENVLIQIYEAGDQAPRFDPLPSPSVVENDTGFALITAYDPDGGDVTISVVDSLLPENFIFVDSGNGVATLEMTPNFVQAGTYIITITVDDGTLQSSNDLIVTIVDAGNQIPVLSPVVDRVVNEGESLVFSVYAADVDGLPVMTMGSPDMPILPYTDNGDGSGTFSWTPGNFDAGSYTAIFYAIDDTDPLLYDSAAITIQVNDVNNLPNYFILPNQQDTVEEGSSIYFTVWAFDVDLTFPTIKPHLDGFPDSLVPNMVLDSHYIDVANDRRVGVLRFSPDFTQGSEPTPTFYQIRFTICDENDPGLCRETTPVAFRVYNINQVPQLIFSTGTGPFTLAESETLNFTVSATDDNGPPDSLVTLGLPANATFDGIQFQKDFTFNPDFTQSGQYFVSFAAYDNQGLADTVIVEINVTDAGNQAPIISTVLPDTIDVVVGVLSQVVIDVAEPDLEAITMTANLATTSLGFTWSGSPGTASGTLSCNADISEAGLLLSAEIIASDPGGLADTVSTLFRVFSTLRGDVDLDSRYTMNDIVYLINYLFKGGPAPSPLDAGDVNKDGLVNVADISYLVNFLYNAGPPPPQ